MASVIEKDNTPFWWASFRDSNGAQHTKSTDILRQTADAALVAHNRHAAQVIADYYERQAEAGLPVGLRTVVNEPVIAGVPSFHVFSRRWVTIVGRDESYRSKLVTYFENVDEILGGKADAQICHLHRADFIGVGPFLGGKGYSGNAITSHLKAVRQCYLSAIQEGFALISPIIPEDFIKDCTRYGPVALSVPVIECLVNATLVIDWRTSMLLGYYLGMDQLDSANLLWSRIALEQPTARWISYVGRGKPTETVLPIHPVLADHLSALKRVGDSDSVTPSLCGKSDTYLRDGFRQIVAESGIASTYEISGRGRRHFAVQFGSLRSAFARDIGHTGSFHLSRFLQGLSPTDRELRIRSLPHLRLNPIPLLTAA